MFHLTLFSCTEGEMTPSGLTAVTLFGSCELRRPTLAREIQHYRATQGRPKSLWGWLVGSEENLVATLFGATEIIEPTVADEYAALTGLLQSRQVAREEIGSLLDMLESKSGGRSTYRSLTLFGACISRRKKAAYERKALDAAVESRGIDARTRSWLDTLVEAPRSVRWRALASGVMAPA